MAKVRKGLAARVAIKIKETADKRRPVQRANAACTVYLEREVVHPTAKYIAKSAGLSLSKWIAALVEKKVHCEKEGLANV